MLLKSITLIFAISFSVGTDAVRSSPESAGTGACVTGSCFIAMVPPVATTATVVYLRRGRFGKKGLIRRAGAAAANAVGNTARAMKELGAARFGNVAMPAAQQITGEDLTLPCRKRRYYRLPKRPQ